MLKHFCYFRCVAVARVGLTGNYHYEFTADEHAKQGLGLITERALIFLRPFNGLAIVFLYLYILINS